MRQRECPLWVISGNGVTPASCPFFPSKQAFVIHAVRRGNTVLSAEKQTPITPLAISQFRARGPNGHGRISLTQDPAVGLQYAGELNAAFIERAGGSIKGEISTGSVPEGLAPVYVHRQSRSLSEILTGMLLGSNNYIANQVFLEIGGHRLGGPVSLEKSLQVAREILAATTSSQLTTLPS